MTTTGGQYRRPRGPYDATLYQVTSSSNARHCTIYPCNAAGSLSTSYHGTTETHLQRDQRLLDRRSRAPVATSIDGATRVRLITVRDAEATT